MKRPIKELIDNRLELSDAGIWMLQNSRQFAYSDGAGPEAYVETVIAKANDLGSDSIELERKVIDWTSEYHLSRTRAQLLKAFQFDSNKRVLEVGCGCGAITRFLGEYFAEVVAIEGSPARARVARSRTRDMSNVTIVNAPFQDLRIRGDFDYIFCIGVFEYSQMFVDSTDPYNAVLQQFRGLLTEGGSLVLAIENQFGLKYFSGSKEDHTSTPYDGIEGYPRYHNKARTFGYCELKDMLHRHFASVEFFYPYPDYKVPECVIAERFMKVPQVSELIATYKARDYPGRITQVFDERLALPEIERNRQLHFFANSFLIIAGQSECETNLFPWLGVHYSSARLPQYQTITRFVSDSHGDIIARKRLAYADQAETSSKVSLHETESEWVGVKSIQAEILARAKNRHLPLRDVLAPGIVWLEYLQEEIRRQGGGPELPGRFIDCIWQNCYETNGKINYIDQEWKWHASVPIEVLGVRAIYRFVCILSKMSDVRKELVRSNWKDLIRMIAREIGMELNAGHFKAFVELESSFLSIVFGLSRERIAWKLRIALTSQHMLSGMQRLSEVASSLRRRVTYRRVVADARRRDS